LADALKKAFQVESQLIEGAGGVFDVHVDGTQVWCKQDVGRFPENEEILDLVKPLAKS